MVVTNLKPAKLAGILSEGMILCAEDAEGNLVCSRRRRICRQVQRSAKDREGTGGYYGKRKEKTTKGDPCRNCSGCSGGGFYRDLLCDKKAPTEGQKTITVSVVDKDGASEEFTYQTDREFLGEVLQDEKLVEGEEGEFGPLSQA